MRVVTPINVPEAIQAHIERGAAVAIGVSGGKDSQAAALATVRYLDEVGHNGPRLLVHADLGRVEWEQSLPVCETLASHLGIELIVERRKAGDMLARWQSRWQANVERYKRLECVKLILPWSTPAMRFCTSELKVAVITSALKKRYADTAIINVAGIRREESSARGRMPVYAINSRLTRRDFAGLNWHPIIDWRLSEVLACVNGSGLQLHEAYTTYGATRVSCAFCIMSTASDLVAAASCEANRNVYLQMVDLEIESAFAFQAQRWLGDVAPHLLTLDQIGGLAHAKEIATRRQALEARIPPRLLYTDGWPTVIPTTEEATLLAEVRQAIASLMKWDSCDFLDAGSIKTRFEQLLRTTSASSHDPQLQLFEELGE
jgi:3'-phosphoadenosine 5'-phosphosulfate sulfotransferase (PAPS reductase)/FAD synthetase